MKKRFIIIPLFVFLIGVYNVRAMTFLPSGTSSGKRGEVIEIFLTLERTINEKEISAVEGIVNYNQEVITLLETSVLQKKWTEFIGINNSKVFSYANLSFDMLLNNNKQNLVKMVFKINDNAVFGDTLLEVSNVKATDENGDYVLIEGGKHNLKVVSGENTLSDLKIDGYDIKFNSDVLIYDLEVENSVSSVKIDASLSDESSVFVLGNGPRNVDLDVGVNEIEIKVMAESGEIKTYQLNIFRKFNKIVEDNTSDDDIETNNKTGDSFIVVIIVIAILSLTFTIIYIFRVKFINNR